MRQPWVEVTVLCCIICCMLSVAANPAIVHAEASYTGERTLIIAPHPDDETLGGAGVIQRALRAGNSVKVVIITNGDGFHGAVRHNFGVSRPTPADFYRLGDIRHQESLHALAQLGVTPEDVIFLGYPDGGISSLWEKNWNIRQLLTGVNGSNHSPYQFSFEKRAPYCGQNLATNLSRIIKDYHPSDIVYPDPHDKHPDHWATSVFVKYVLAKDSYAGKEWTYLVHRSNFPFPWSYSPDLPMNPPAMLRDLDTKWHYFANSKEDQAQKLKAIQKYETQTRVMQNFLFAFIRTNDLLGTYSDPLIPYKTEYHYFHDPTGDTTKSRMRGSLSGTDITEFGVFQSDLAIYPGVKIKDGIHSGIGYRFLLRLISSEKLKRIEVLVQDKQIVSILSDGQNDSLLQENCKVVSDQKSLWVVIPKKYVSANRGIILTNRTSYQNELLDSTAWRYMR